MRGVRCAVCGAGHASCHGHAPKKTRRSSRRARGKRSACARAWRAHGACSVDACTRARGVRTELAASTRARARCMTAHRGVASGRAARHSASVDCRATAAAAAHRTRDEDAQREVEGDRRPSKDAELRAAAPNTVRKKEASGVCPGGATEQHEVTAHLAAAASRGRSPPAASKDELDVSRLPRGAAAYPAQHPRQRFQPARPPSV